MGSDGFQDEKGNFSLDEHEDLTGQEISDDLGQFFSSISKEYAPLSENLLPNRVLETLNKTIDKIPIIEPFQIYERIKKMNIPNSTVPGDFPPRIWKLYSAELASPLAIIVNRILQTGEWPTKFKIEWVSVIAKKVDPESKSDLRNLSLTLFIAKAIENIICDLLIQRWGHKIDGSQYGGRKGYSVTLYLIKLVDFVLSNLEKSVAVLIAMVDFSKAYNRQSHNRLLTCYNDLGTPTYLLKVLKSYLTNRKLIVRHNGHNSKVYDLPGGGPQGTNLGILNFLVYINSCGVPFEKMMECIQHEHKEQYFGHPVEENQVDPIETLGWVRICHPVLPDPDPSITKKEARFKYIDDKVAAEVIKLSTLEKITSNVERPLNYHDRTLNKLPDTPGLLQNKLTQMDSYCKVQQMKINNEKSKTAIFNTSTTRDFHPRITDSNGKIYENVDDFVLLGVDIVPHPKLGISWEKYIMKCIKKAYNKMWILKRLSEVGVTTKDLLMTYESRLRSQLEMNVPLWSSSISKKLSIQIEKVQKSCLYIILGKKATQHYNLNLQLLKLDRLDERRDKLCENYARKIIKHPQHRETFTWVKKTSTRTGPKVVVPYARTERYRRSAIPNLACLINKI